METKTFPLQALLSVTTGRLLMPIEDFYEILRWMTDDNPLPNQLGRFVTECTPWLLRWFPELSLASDELGTLDQLLENVNTSTECKSACESWLSGLAATGSFKKTYEVPHIPQDDHERKDPIDELVASRGTDEGIIIADGSGNP